VKDRSVTAVERVVPVAAEERSSPSPANIESSPVPPSRVSLPSKALTVSFPASPSHRVVAAVPVSESLPAVSGYRLAAARRAIVDSDVGCDQSRRALQRRDELRGVPAVTVRVIEELAGRSVVHHAVARIVPGCGASSGEETLVARTNRPDATRLA
jgi:hypothetical protein